MLYGNNHSVNYQYDNFDRITSINKMNNNYLYYYDNNNNLAKVISDLYDEKYNYDLANRLIE